MSLVDLLLLSLLLFCLGLFAVVSRRHLVGMLIGAELMLNAALLNFLAFGHFSAPEKVTSQVASLFIIGLAAAEVAIALSIVVSAYRLRRSADADLLSELQG